MSSSRSLASARTKRATGNPPVPNQPEQSGEPHSAAPQSVTKLTIPQAFGRINERLNNFELFAETTTGVVNEIQEFHSNTSDKYIVDKEVFTSIVSRIDTLERTHSDKSGSDISATSSSSSSTMLNDIDELKTHLIRLQTYVMETNAKLQDIVFHTNGTSLVNFNDVFSDTQHPPPTLMQNVNVQMDQRNKEDTAETSTFDEVDETHSDGEEEENNTENLE